MEACLLFIRINKDKIMKYSQSFHDSSLQCEKKLFRDLKLLEKVFIFNSWSKTGNIYIKKNTRAHGQTLLLRDFYKGRVFQQNYTNSKEMAEIYRWLQSDVTHSNRHSSF